ncbi:MAG TPA: class I SAM-dependent methyltransferase [Trebonia sp.]
MPDAPFKPDQTGFNTWHTDVAGSPACDFIFRRALALPDHVVSNSLLPWWAIPEIAAALRLVPGGILVDLACGRGSYGRELARRTAARLIGVDFSEVALAMAASSATTARDGDPGQDGHNACFAVSDFTATALRDDSVDAVICVDSVQFSDPPLAALRECRRILAPGGSLAVTAWEATDPSNERVPARTRRMNLARDLAEAGFAEVEVTSKPDWHEAERALWEAAVRTDPNDDPGLVSLRKEAMRSLATHASKRRVLATATSP